MKKYNIIFKCNVHAWYRVSNFTPPMATEKVKITNTRYLCLFEVKMKTMMTVTMSTIKTAVDLYIINVGGTVFSSAHYCSLLL